MYFLRTRPRRSGGGGGKTEAAELDHRTFEVQWLALLAHALFASAQSPEVLRSLRNDYYLPMVRNMRVIPLRGSLHGTIVELHRRGS